MRCLKYKPSNLTKYNKYFSNFPAKRRLRAQETCVEYSG